jgi:hypothetical protein
LRAVTVIVPVACLMGAAQAGLIIGVGKAKERDIEWPSITMAVASAVLLAAGVLRHYIDVYMHRTVRGISFIFVGIDALGDVFSRVSVVFQPTLDVLGMVIYATELVLWIGIFLCGAYYNLLPWLKNSHKISPREVHASADSNGRDGVVVSSGLALHDLPSSTSVFRTPSGHVEVMPHTVRDV